MLIMSAARELVLPPWSASSNTQTTNIATVMYMVNSLVPQACPAFRRPVFRTVSDKSWAGPRYKAT